MSCGLSDLMRMIANMDYCTIYPRNRAARDKKHVYVVKRVKILVKYTRVRFVPYFCPDAQQTSAKCKQVRALLDYADS